MGRSGDDSCHRLTLITHLGDSQRIIFNSRKRIRTNFDERLGLLRDFRAGQSANHTGQRFRNRSVHAHDAGMPVRGTHKVQIEHVVKLEVVNELAASAHETIVFLARKLLADPAAALW